MIASWNLLRRPCEIPSCACAGAKALSPTVLAKLGRLLIHPPTSANFVGLISAPSPIPLHVVTCPGSPRLVGNRLCFNRPFGGGGGGGASWGIARHLKPRVALSAECEGSIAEQTPQASSLCARAWCSERGLSSLEFGVQVCPKSGGQVGPNSGGPVGVLRDL